MFKRKRTCKILKEIRRQIAENNDIEYVTSECQHQGDCAGTCPKCEAEVRYLERELERRARLGKAVTVAGLAVTITATTLSATACTFFGTATDGDMQIEGDLPPEQIDPAGELPPDIVEEGELPPEHLWITPHDLEADLTQGTENLLHALQSLGYATDEARLALRREWADLHQKRILNIDYYLLDGEGWQRRYLAMTFTDNGCADPDGFAQIVTEYELLCAGGPEALIALPEKERIAALEQMITDDGYEKNQAWAALPKRWKHRVDYSHQCYQYHLYFRLYPYVDIPPAVGEPEFLLVSSNSHGDIIGVSVLYADEEPTIPESSLEIRSIGKHLSDYTKQAFSLLREQDPDLDPAAYLRQRWEKTYLGSRDGVDYYITEYSADGSCYHYMGLRVPVTGAVEIADTGSRSGSDTIPPHKALSPEALADLSEQERVARYLACADGAYRSDAPTIEQAALRGEIILLWKNYYIGSSADSDYYALAPLDSKSTPEKARTQLLKVSYGKDRTLRSMTLVDMSARPAALDTTILDVYQYQSTFDPAWLEAFASLFHATDARAQSLVTNALRDYYLRKESYPDEQKAPTVYFFALPSWGTEDRNVPVSAQFWIEYGENGILRVGEGEYRPMRIEF